MHSDMGQFTQYLGRKVNHYIIKINKAYTRNKTEIPADRDSSGATS